MSAEALGVARYLAECGVPIFVGKVTENGGLLAHWKEAKADPSVVDKWKPGMALCAVMGHVVDAIDVDPRNEGHIDVLRSALGGELPRVYGVQSTPSGGKHYLIASLNVRKVGEVVKGVDIQAGNSDGAGRGVLFLAPTVRINKTTNEPGTYTWEQQPDLGPLLLDDDESGAALAALVDAKHSQTRGTLDAQGSYEGASYSEMTDAQRREADELVASYCQSWKKLLADAVDWPDCHRDERGRGWEALAFQSAWAFAKMASCPWMGIDEEDAKVMYEDVLPPELAENESCAGKWDEGLVSKAALEPVDVPPWVVRGDPADDFQKARPICDHTNEAHVSTWLDAEVGRNGLAGMFRRGEDLVYTPRVGEEGYIPPKNSLDYDGPAQVRRMTSIKLANRIDASYRVVQFLKNGKTKDMIFKRELAERALSDLDMFPNVHDLRMVTHTPIVRADGTVLDVPGFDTASGALYLPERGLEVDPVPDVPTEQDVVNARKLLLNMLEDFPFVSDHDRANYLGCLMVPLIRILVPPPYKMLIIGAPQRGSGKSLLALLMRTIHGGVFRSEIPHEEDERRKVITSILDSTSAPVVQFDNVSGVLRSSVFDGLLTSSVWSDRRLGVNVNLELPNDRLWVATGNNVTIGGDLERRVLWCTIDSNMEHPELRPAEDFGIPDLEEWVRVHRGDLLHAMLVLVRAWAVAGMPKEPAPTSDSFGHMTAVLRGVLSYAGIPGEVGHGSSKPDRPDLDAEDWSAFLLAAHREMGDEWWTSKELLENVSEFEGGIDLSELPADLGDKLRHSSSGAIKSLGKMMAKRNGQWASGLKLEGRRNGKAAMGWRIVTGPGFTG